MFIGICIVSLLLGRRIAWWLCRKNLYPMPSNWAAGFVCMVWGVGLAYGLRELIIAQHPHWAVKYLLGYGVGGYLAFMNYGLFQNDTETVPLYGQIRHLIIEVVPFLTFVIASVLFGFILR
jgi:hypothetical protein